jgi:SAM-dependent methyltransferase
MNLPIDQSEFWNNAASCKEFTHPFDSEKFAHRVSLDASILDYGCGQGRLCHVLTRLGFRSVQGADSPEEMIRIARLGIADLAFLVVDGSNLLYATGSIDVVLLFAVLTCIPSDAGQRKLMAEVVRVLRPGGLLLVSDYPLQSDERNRKRYGAFANELGTFGVFRLPDGSVFRHHEEDWLDGLFENFEIEERVEVDSLTMNGNPARIVQIWARRSAERT